MATLNVDNGSETVGKFRHLYESGEFSDMELKVGNHKFKTHRLVLCMGSDVMKTMLMSKFWPEGRSNRVVLQEDEECSEVFDKFLLYLYTGTVTLTQDNALPLLMLADKYNVAHLSKSCLSYMNANCCLETIHNSVSWLQYAVICGYKCIEEKCSLFIKNNFDSVMKTAEFIHLSKECLLKFVQSSDIVVSDELTLFICLRNWALLNPLEDEEENDRQFKEIMKNVRFPMLNLCDITFLETIFKESDMFKDFFMERIFNAIRYHTGSIRSVYLPTNLLKRLDALEKFNPRIYLQETWSTQMCLENVSMLPEGLVLGAFFSTPISCSEKDQQEHRDWNIVFYPHGVKYEPCLMIGVPNVMNPGGLFKSVRLAICTECDKMIRFKVSVLVMGRSENNDDFVYSSITKDVIFNKDCSRFHFEDIIPFEEMKNPDSLYFEKQDSVRIQIVIRPVFSM